MNQRHNGWANYETWSIALSIGHNKELYRMARAFARNYHGRTLYRDFATMMKGETVNGVSWTDRRISYGELNAFLRSLR